MRAHGVSELYTQSSNCCVLAGKLANQQYCLIEVCGEWKALPFSVATWATKSAQVISRKSIFAWDFQLSQIIVILCTVQ
jgi:hypothetical protein